MANEWSHQYWVDKLAEYPELMSRPEVERVLGSTPQRVKTLTKSGALRSRRSGKNVVVPKCALIEYMVEAEAKPTAEAS